MKQATLETACAFAEKVRAENPDQVKAIFFYGSRARGDDSVDSDYDLCIVVDRESPELEDRILEAAVEWLNRYDVFISPLLCSEPIFSRYQEAGVYREIRREGIRL